MQALFPLTDLLSNEIHLDSALLHLGRGSRRVNKHNKAVRTSKMLCIFSVAGWRPMPINKKVPG